MLYLLELLLQYKPPPEASEASEAEFPIIDTFDNDGLELEQYIPPPNEGAILFKMLQLVIIGEDE